MRAQLAAGLNDGNGRNLGSPGRNGRRLRLGCQVDADTTQGTLTARFEWFLDAEKRHEPWQMDSLLFWLFFYDYGGEAVVDAYSQTNGNQTVTLVFMYTDNPRRKQEIKDIVRSFKWKPQPKT